MNDSIDPATLNDPRDLAAYWFTRVRSGTMTAAEHQAFAAWRHADPDNERQYRYVERLWDAAGNLPEHQLRALGYPAVDAAARPAGKEAGRVSASGRRALAMSVGRRRVAYGLGAACGVGILAATAGYGLWHGAPDYDVAFATRRGERLSERLPDGTVLDLNGGTMARVRFYRDRRTVALAAGEILCRVAPDRTRPFAVDFETGSARAVGTCFNVRREHDGSQVAVEEGEVEVSTGPWWRRNSTRLVAGWEARLEQDKAPVVRGGVDVAAKTAWRDGQIVFNSTPLPEAIAELNRYLSRAVLLPDSRVRSLRISGIFRIDDPGALLGALPRILPVQVLARADGATEIVAR